MSVLDFFKSLRFFNTKDKFDTVFYGQLIAEECYKLLAVETCVNLIADVLSSCEFQTLENGKEVRKESYYLFNVKPNQNQNASVFWRELVSVLFKENEALIVQNNDKLYIADDFYVDEYVMYENLYSDVRVGDFTFRERFKASNVFYFKLNNVNISKILDVIYKDYGKLLAAAKNNYKRKNTPRLIIDIDSNLTQNDEKQKAVREYLGKQFKSFFEADGAGSVAPLYQGMKLNEKYNQNQSSAVYTTRDIRGIIDDVFDFTARAFNIPINIIKGDVVGIEQAVDLFIAQRIKPLAELIKDEINAKYYSKTQYLSRTYLKIDTSRIRATDILKLATAADKLFAAGVNTINDNLHMFDREALEELWADERFVTKNYQEVNKLGREDEKDESA